MGLSRIRLRSAQPPAGLDPPAEPESQPDSEPKSAPRASRLQVVPAPRPELRLAEVPEAAVTARVIAFANQKGGVAKTTTTLNLGVALGERGKRVLQCDAEVERRRRLGHA